MVQFSYRSIWSIALGSRGERQIQAAMISKTKHFHEISLDFRTCWMSGLTQAQTRLSLRGNDSKMRQKQLVSYLILIYLLFYYNNKTLLLEK